MFSVPGSISRLTRLRALCLAGNHIAAAPEGMSRLERLRLLDVSGNGLVSLPAGISRLTALESLLLGGNRLSQLPAGWRMPHLAAADLSRNSFRWAGKAWLARCRLQLPWPCWRA